MPFVLQLLVAIAARESDPAFTSRVSGWLVELSRRPGRGVDPVFGPNSSLDNHLDTAAAVPELVRLAAASPGRQRYIDYLRALECERPAHMPGCDAVPPADLGVVGAAAVEATGMRGRFTTSEFHQKEAAWDVLLCHGDPARLPPCGDAVAGETGFVAQRFLALAACVGAAPLPPPVGPLIAGLADGGT